MYNFIETFLQNSYNNSIDYTLHDEWFVSYSNKSNNTNVNFPFLL